MRAEQKSSVRMTGREVYMKYKDLVKRDGKTNADKIRTLKKNLQLADPEHHPPHWMKHPELHDDPATWSYILPLSYMLSYLEC